MSPGGRVSEQPSHRGEAVGGGRSLRASRDTRRGCALRAVLLCTAAAWLTLGSTPPRAAGREIVIALDVHTPDLDRTQSEQVTGLFRSELGKTGRFTLADRTEMNSELGKLGYRQGEGCDTARCYVPLSRTLGVDRIISARIDRQGSAYALSAQWVVVGQGATIRPTALAKPVGTLAEVFSSGIGRLAEQVAAAASEAPGAGGGGGAAASAAPGTVAPATGEGAKAWLDKGFALRQPNGNYQPPELAVYQFSKAISAEPNNATAHAARGQVYLQLQQYDDAIKDYTQAIRLEPRRAAHYYGRALVYEALHQKAQQCVDLRKACELGDQGGCSLGKKSGC